MKSANHYASRVQVPEYVENAIVALNRHQRLNFASDLIACIRDRHTSSAVLSGKPYEWLCCQSVFTFTALHQWVSMELI